MGLLVRTVLFTIGILIKVLVAIWAINQRLLNVVFVQVY